MWLGLAAVLALLSTAGRGGDARAPPAHQAPLRVMKSMGDSIRQWNCGLLDDTGYQFLGYLQALSPRPLRWLLPPAAGAALRGASPTSKEAHRRCRAALELHADEEEDGGWRAALPEPLVRAPVMTG